MRNMLAGVPLDKLPGFPFEELPNADSRFLVGGMKKSIASLQREIARR